MSNEAIHRDGDSSPDPLAAPSEPTGSQRSPYPPKSPSVTSAQPNRALLLDRLTPTKSVTTVYNGYAPSMLASSPTNTGLGSPWRIRVTVEAQGEGSGPDHLPGVHFEGGTAMVSGLHSQPENPTTRYIQESQATTKVPLKDAHVPLPAQPPRRRGRPRKSDVVNASTTSKMTKSQAKGKKTSAANPAGTQQGINNSTEAPPKRRRGRPPKQRPPPTDDVAASEGPTSTRDLPDSSLLEPAAQDESTQVMDTSGVSETIELASPFTAHTANDNLAPRDSRATDADSSEGAIRAVSEAPGPSSSPPQELASSAYAADLDTTTNMRLDDEHDAPDMDSVLEHEGFSMISAESLTHISTLALKQAAYHSSAQESSSVESQTGQNTAAVQVHSDADFPSDQANMLSRDAAAPSARVGLSSSVQGEAVRDSSSLTLQASAVNQSNLRAKFVSLSSHNAVTLPAHGEGGPAAQVSDAGPASQSVVPSMEDERTSSSDEVGNFVADQAELDHFRRSLKDIRASNDKLGYAPVNTAVTAREGQPWHANEKRDVEAAKVPGNSDLIGNDDNGSYSTVTPFSQTPGPKGNAPPDSSQLPTQTVSYPRLPPQFRTPSNQDESESEGDDGELPRTGDRATSSSRRSESPVSVFGDPKHAAFVGSGAFNATLEGLARRQQGGEEIVESIEPYSIDEWDTEDSNSSSDDDSFVTETSSESSSDDDDDDEASISVATSEVERLDDTGMLAESTPLPGRSASEVRRWAASFETSGPKASANVRNESSTNVRDESFTSVRIEHPANVRNESSTNVGNETVADDNIFNQASRKRPYSDSGANVTAKYMKTSEDAGAREPVVRPTVNEQVQHAVWAGAQVQLGQANTDKPGSQGYNATQGHIEAQGYNAVHRHIEAQGYNVAQGHVEAQAERVLPTITHLSPSPRLSTPLGLWLQVHQEHLEHLYERTDPATRARVFQYSTRRVPHEPFYTTPPPSANAGLVAAVFDRMRSLGSFIFSAPARPQDVSPVLRGLSGPVKALFGHTLHARHFDVGVTMGEPELATIERFLRDCRVDNNRSGRNGGVRRANFIVDEAAIQPYAAERQREAARLARRGEHDVFSPAYLMYRLVHLICMLDPAFRERFVRVDEARRQDVCPSFQTRL